MRVTKIVSSSGTKNKKPGKKTARVIKRVREKLEQDFDSYVDDFEEKIRQLKLELLESNKECVRNCTYFLCDGKDLRGVYLLKDIIKGHTILYLFEDVVTKTKVTFTTVSLKEIPLIAEVSEKDIEEWKKNYFSKQKRFRMDMLQSVID